MARLSPIERAERVANILHLRKSGCTYREIGEQLQISSETARLTVQKVIQQYIEEAKDAQHEIIMLELLRLDDMLYAVYDSARGGELKAVDSVLKIMERRAKLLGLDAQVTTRTVQLSVTPEQITGMSDDELAQLIQQFDS
jgi:orotate phosphoribosyltransferase-like protein